MFVFFFRSQIAFLQRNKSSSRARRTTMTSRNKSLLVYSVFVLFVFSSELTRVANAFLFTPKFKLYLDFLRNSNKEFVVKWQPTNNNAGFSYTTNQYGEFDQESISFAIEKWSNLLVASEMSKWYSMFISMKAFFRGKMPS